MKINKIKIDIKIDDFQKLKIIKINKDLEILFENQNSIKKELNEMTILLENKKAYTTLDFIKSLKKEMIKIDNLIDEKIIAFLNKINKKNDINLNEANSIENIIKEIFLYQNIIKKNTSLNIKLV